MKNHEPIAWMFDWTSPEVDKPTTSISFSYPVNEQDVIVSNIRALYVEDYVAELIKFSRDLIAENAGLKNKIDELEVRIAELTKDNEILRRDYDVSKALYETDLQNRDAQIDEFKKPCIDNACGYCRFLEEENRTLKARIADGVRVYAKLNANNQLSYVSNYPAPDIKLSAATLLLDEQGYL